MGHRAWGMELGAWSLGYGKENGDWRKERPEKVHYEKLSSATKTQRL